MEKEFVPYELALKMKQLGFDEPCLMYIDDEEDLINDNTAEWIGAIKCPLKSQAFRWFRETYDWQHSIDPTADQHSHKLGYNYWIWNYKTGEEHYTMPKNRPTGDWEYETYEEAELACIDKLIEIIENQK